MKWSTKVMNRDLLGFPAIAGFAIGTAIMYLVTTYTPPQIQVGLLGVLLVMVLSIVIAVADQVRTNSTRIPRMLSVLRAPINLAADPELFRIYDDVTRSLMRLANNSDVVLREFAVLKLFNLTSNLRDISHGTVVFTATESWRQIYERILVRPDVGSYQSVAWFRTEDYWRDRPGQRSMHLNLKLAQRGLPIHRVLILCDFFWPPKAAIPAKDVCEWLKPQVQAGIKISLVRESELLGEQDLMLDFGIYGDLATGIQYTDVQCRTERFVLHFDRQNIELGKDRWQRLLMHTVSFEELLKKRQLGNAQ